MDIARAYESINIEHLNKVLNIEMPKFPDAIIYNHKDKYRIFKIKGLPIGLCQVKEIFNTYLDIVL